MTDTHEAVRLEFERYFLESRKSKGTNRNPTFERFEDGTYKDDHTQRHWWTWQNALLRRIPELEAEVQEQARLNGMGAERELALMAQVSRLEAERDGLNAARFAYASEFGLDGEGQPDVGSIHQNIRALKAERDQLRAELEKVSWQPIETAPKDGTLFLCWVSAVRYGETDEGQQYQQDASQVDFCQWLTQPDIPDCGWFDPCCGQIADQQYVTHWMPLPASPTTPNADQKGQ